MKSFLSSRAKKQLHFFETYTIQMNHLLIFLVSMIYQSLADSHLLSQNLALDSKFYFSTVAVIILGNINTHIVILFLYFFYFLFFPHSYFRQHLIFQFLCLLMSNEMSPQFSSSIFSYNDTQNNHNHQKLDLIFKILKAKTQPLKKAISFLLVCFFKHSQFSSSTMSVTFYPPSVNPTICS